MPRIRQPGRHRPNAAIQYEFREVNHIAWNQIMELQIRHTGAGAFRERISRRISVRADQFAVRIELDEVVRRPLAVGLALIRRLIIDGFARVVRHIDRPIGKSL